MEKFSTDSEFIVWEVGTNFTQYVHWIRLWPLAAQFLVDDLTVVIYENLQGGPSWHLLRGEAMFFVESIPSFLRPFTRVVTRQDNKDDPPHVAVCFRISVPPAHIQFRVAANPTPVHPRVVAIAPVPVVLPELFEKEAAEPPSPELPLNPLEDVLSSNSCDISLPSENLQKAIRLSENPPTINQAEKTITSGGNT